MTVDDTPTAGRFEGRAHWLPARIYYEDTDFTGVVYHANYLRYLERGRSDFLRLAGIGHAQLMAASAPTAFAVTRISLDFRRPARIDDALLVRTTYDRTRGPRIEIAQTILRGADIIVEAAVEACCIDAIGRPKKPPMLLRDALQPFLQP